MLACCVVRWWGVPLLQVVLGSFWVISDGFCWLRVTLDGFRWFAVLVLTSVSQHTEHLTLYCMVARDWLRSFDFFIQSKTARKIFLLLCRLAVWKQVTISYIPLCFISDKKISFKGNFFNKQSQNTKQVWVLQNIWNEELSRGASQKFSNTGRLFAMKGRREEMNHNEEISPLDGERRRVCRIVWCDDFSVSYNLFTAIKKVCVIFFCCFDQFILA